MKIKNSTDGLIKFMQPESLPDTRKKVVLRKDLAIIEANKSHNLDEMINAEINFCISALPEIKEKGFQKSTIFKLKPSFNEVKKQFLKDLNLIHPILLNRYLPYIEYRRKEIYLARLQEYRSRLENKLVHTTDWYFDYKEQRATF